MQMSCGCFFAILAKLRGKINLPDKIIVNINTLDAVPTGFVRSMGNHFFHKLAQERRSQPGRLGVLLDNLQKALNVNGFCFGGGYYTS